MKKLLFLTALFIISGCDNSLKISNPTINPLPDSGEVNETKISNLITQRCTSCHSSKTVASDGIRFDSYQDMVSKARRIKREVVDFKSMPPNPSEITDEERALIGKWAEQQNK